MKMFTSLSLTLIISLLLAALFWWVSILSGHDENAARDVSVQGFICGVVACAIFWYGRNKKNSS